MLQKTFGRAWTVKDTTVLFGRLLLATIFLHEAATLSLHFGAASTAMQKVGVPPPLLAATIGLQLSASLSIAGGIYSRLGATALGLFCLMTALFFHRNFAIQNELLHFEKDFAIAGGLFVLAARGPGSLSVAGLLHRRTRSKHRPDGEDYSLMSH